jgi:hypothetical protein
VVIPSLFIPAGRLKTISEILAIPENNSSNFDPRGLDD